MMVNAFTFILIMTQTQYSFNNFIFKHIFHLSLNYVVENKLMQINDGMTQLQIIIFFWIIQIQLLKLNIKAI